MAARIAASRTSKVVFGASLIFATLSIGGVHLLQVQERETMYAGVIRDDARMAAKRAQRAREAEFEEQARKRAYLEGQQPVSNPIVPPPKVKGETVVDVTVGLAGWKGCNNGKRSARFTYFAFMRNRTDSQYNPSPSTPDATCYLLGLNVPFRPPSCVFSSSNSLSFSISISSRADVLQTLGHAHRLLTPPASSSVLLSLPSSTPTKSVSAPSMPPSKKAKVTNTSSVAKQKQNLKVLPPWTDLPDWTDKAGICYFFRCPSEVIDKILSSPILNVRDHLALAATCRSLRAGYSPAPPIDGSGRAVEATITPTDSPLWQALITKRPIPSLEEDIPRVFFASFLGLGAEWFPDLTAEEQEWRWDLRREGRSNKEIRDIIDEKRHEVREAQEKLISRIFSGGVNVKDMMILRSETAEAWRTGAWNSAIEFVNDKLDGKVRLSVAKEHYKLSHAECRKCLPTKFVNNQFWVHIARVESLAFRLHGGPLGYKSFLEMSATRGD